MPEGENNNEGNNNEGVNNEGTDNDDGRMSYDDWNNTGWRENLPEELATNATLANFKTAADAIKGFIHTKKMVGNSIPKPEDGWNKEQWKEYNLKYTNGFPKDPEEYDLNMEFDGYEPSDGQKAKFRQWAHENGLSKAQAQMLYRNIHSEAANSRKSFIESQSQKQQQIIADLKQSWGNAFPQEIENAKKFADAFIPQEYMEQFKKMNMPKEMIMAFAKAGRHLSEGKLETNSQPQSKLTPREALSKFNKYVEDNKEAYHDKMNARHDEVVKKSQELMAQAYPDED